MGFFLFFLWLWYYIVFFFKQMWPSHSHFCRDAASHGRWTWCKRQSALPGSCSESRSRATAINTTLSTVKYRIQWETCFQTRRWQLTSLTEAKRVCLAGRSCGRAHYLWRKNNKTPKHPVINSSKLQRFNNLSTEVQPRLSLLWQWRMDLIWSEPRTSGSGAAPWTVSVMAKNKSFLLLCSSLDKI